MKRPSRQSGFKSRHHSFPFLLKDISSSGGCCKALSGEGARQNLASASASCSQPHLLASTLAQRGQSEQRRNNCLLLYLDAF